MFSFLVVLARFDRIRIVAHPSRGVVGDVYPSVAQARTRTGSNVVALERCCRDGNMYPVGTKVRPMIDRTRCPISAESCGRVHRKARLGIVFPCRC